MGPSCMTTEPRIICVGGNQESFVALQGLVEAKANVVAVVTLPAGQAKPACDYFDLHDPCQEWGIPTIDAKNINRPSLVPTLSGLEPDYIYTLGWNQLFGMPLLQVPREYAVGSHPSLLPEGRGRAPIPWAILEGKNHMAVSLFRMDAGVDAGPILLQKPFELPSVADAQQVYQLVAENLRDAFCQLLRLHRSQHTVAAVAQDESQASYRAKRVPADGHIDFQRPAEEIARLIRAVSHPYPGAYAYYQGSRISIWKSRLDGVPNYRGVPGQIVKIEENRLLVQANDTPLWISDFSEDDHGADISQFRAGDRFGYAIEDEIHQLRNEIRILRRIVENQRDTLSGKSAA